MPVHHLNPHEQHHRRHHHKHRAGHALSRSNADFLKVAIPAAKNSEKESGVPASITLAQACIESGWGNHHIGKANNYFGIKAPLVRGNRKIGDVATGFVETKTQEYNKKHELYTIVDAFRSYVSMEDSFKDHGLWIRNNTHYPGAIDQYQKTGDADLFALALQKGGYAGRDNIVYAESIIKMMKRHDFYQYNAVVPPASSTKIK